MEQTVTDRAAENDRLLREGYAAFGSGDLEAVERMFRPDAVWHAQRLGRLGGDHRGWPAILAFFAETMSMTKGTFHIEVQDVLANDRQVAVVLRSKAERDGLRLDDGQIHLYRIQDGLVAEIWQFVGDGPTVEAFWS